MKEWIKANIKDFKSSIRSEEDLKVKVILPYLHFLGYSDALFRFENAIDVTIGSKRTKVFSDIEIVIDGKVEIVIDTKTPQKSISEKDVLQSSSYAKLVDTPPALYGITTNGLECIVTNVYTGKRTEVIPSLGKLKRDIDSSKKKDFKDIEIREAESVLFTLHNTKDLYKVISDCKNIIEKRALIRSDQSFREMTKILLIKMNEERRVKAREGNNRFILSYIQASAKANNTTEISIFRQLFNDAKSKYPSIYTNNEEQLQITDNACIVEIIKQLEPFSFIGTGDDIKGTAYEVFLKSTLRGEFDQYFTPREIVDFMVKCADPDIGDIILDPACGSGGFLIQAFNYVNHKINDSGSSEIDNNNKFQALIDKCLWGHEADYDLHVLAKINLIMHGDGWNNIYQGDTLSSTYLPDNYFDLVLANPPFTIPYTFSDVLSKYDLGFGKVSEELDILFVEKSINVLKPGHDLYIVLPEGLLNIKKYEYFREWLFQKSDMVMSISLPEGAFIPFGGSVSKTCILGVRKKGSPKSGYTPPKYVFLGKATEVGYEVGKKKYIPGKKNDLEEMAYSIREVFEGVKSTSNGGECGWILQSDITSNRIDANYLLNKIDRYELKQKFPILVPLKEVCTIENISISVRPDSQYYYLEVPDISEATGAITNVRRLFGHQLHQTSFHKFFPGDILFTRINPRKSRIAIAPPIEDSGIMSKEIFRIVWKHNPYITQENQYVLCAILQSSHVHSQIVRLSTGSSSSRARVQEQDLLNDVFIPIPQKSLQKKISVSLIKSTSDIWNCSQQYLFSYAKNQSRLGTVLTKDELRSV